MTTPDSFDDLFLDLDGFDSSGPITPSTTTDDQLARSTHPAHPETSLDTDEFIDEPLDPWASDDGTSSFEQALRAEGMLNTDGEPTTKAEVASEPAFETTTVEELRSDQKVPSHPHVELASANEHIASPEPEAEQIVTPGRDSETAPVAASSATASKQAVYPQTSSNMPRTFSFHQAMAIAAVTLLISIVFLAFLWWTLFYREATAPTPTPVVAPVVTAKAVEPVALPLAVTEPPPAAPAAEKPLAASAPPIIEPPGTDPATSVIVEPKPAPTLPTPATVTKPKSTPWPKPVVPKRQWQDDANNALDDLEKRL